jgi:hypothetical protein
MNEIDYESQLIGVVVVACVFGGLVIAVADFIGFL